MTRLWSALSWDRLPKPGHPAPSQSSGGQDLLGVVREQIIPHADHIRAHIHHPLQSWVAHHMVGNVHVQLHQHKGVEGADGLAPQVKVALDVAHSAEVPSVTALLYYGVGVALKGRDEPFLAEECSGLEGVVPESKGVPGSE